MASKKVATQAPTIEIASHVIPKITLNMPVDARRAKAIQKCIENGNLRITINKVDLSAGRLGDGWLYD
jgi:hypothetical protein